HMSSRSVLLKLRPPLISTLFPYTTLFRSEYQRDQQASLAVDVATFLAQQQWQEQAKMLDLDRVQIHKTILPQHSQSNPTSAHGVRLFQFLGQLQQEQLAFKQINYRHRGDILPQCDNRTQLKQVGPL